MSNAIYRAYVIPNPSEASINRSIHKHNSPYTGSEFPERNGRVYYPSDITIPADAKYWLLVYKIIVGQSYLLPTEVTQNQLSYSGPYLYGDNYWESEARRVKDWVRGNSTSRKFDEWNEGYVRSVCDKVLNEIIFSDPHDTPLHRSDMADAVAPCVELLRQGDPAAAHYWLYRNKSRNTNHVNVNNVYTKADIEFKKLYAFFPWLDVTDTGNEDEGSATSDFANIPSRDKDLT